MAAIAAIALVAVPARADATADAVTAQALFDEARALMARAEYAQACPKLEESERLDPGVGTLLNLGDCYERTHRLASAWSTFLEAASAAHDAHEGARERVADDRAAALAPRLPKIVVRLRSPEVPGTSIQRDGRTIGRAELGVAVPADPGVHVVTASAPGRGSWKSTVEVREGAPVETVDVPELPPAAEPSSAGLGPWRVGALVTGAVSLAAAAAGAGWLVTAKSERDDANAVCPASRCSDAGAVAKSQAAVRDANAGTVAMVVAGAGAATGLVLWVTGKPAGSRAALTSWSLTVAPREIGLVSTW